MTYSSAHLHLRPSDVPYIFDIAKVYDRGEITVETVETLLADLYGPENTSDKQAHRERVIRSGEINKLSLIGLNARVREVPRTEAAAVEEPIPEAFLRDVPDPVYARLLTSPG